MPLKRTECGRHISPLMLMPGASGTADNLHLADIS